MAEVEITPVKAAPRGHLRVHASLPLAALDEQRCIRDQRVPADMIEMKVRVDDEVNLAGISVYGLQSCADFFARLKPDTEKAVISPSPPSIRCANSTGHRAASESVELDCHLRSAGLADGIACLVLSR